MHLETIRFLQRCTQRHAATCLRELIYVFLGAPGYRDTAGRRQCPPRVRFFPKSYRRLYERVCHRHRLPRVFPVRQYPDTAGASFCVRMEDLPRAEIHASCLEDRPSAFPDAEYRCQQSSIEHRRHRVHRCFPNYRHGSPSL